MFRKYNFTGFSNLRQTQREKQTKIGRRIIKHKYRFTESTTKYQQNREDSLKMSEILQQVNAGFKRLKKAEKSRKLLTSTSAFISELESVYSELEATEDNFDKSHLDRPLAKKLEESHKQWDETVKADIKATDSNISKFGKSSIEKIDEFELDQVYIYKIPKNDLNLRLVDNSIKLHLIRNGDLSVLNESWINDTANDSSTDLSSRIDLSILSKFNQMNDILKKIQNRDLKDAIEWTIENERTLVNQFGSELEFKLHRLQYLQYYEEGRTLEALSYARKWFTKFINPSSANDKNLVSVAKLMASNLFLNDDQSSPYFQNNQLLDSSFKEAAVLFSKEFCSVLGFAFESSIFSIVLSGMISTPSFLKFVQIKNLNNRLDWTSHDELPFEINLPSFLRKYHPIFICPVSKEETTLENPPIALPCHHVISKHSLGKLSRNGSNFKCPYCPTNCLASQCKQVTFYHI